MSTVSIRSRVVWPGRQHGAVACVCWRQPGQRSLRWLVGKAILRHKLATEPRVSPAGTATSVSLPMPHWSAPITALRMTAPSIAARLKVAAAVQMSTAAAPRIATPAGGAHTHRPMSVIQATPVRPPSSVSGRGPEPFASTPSRPATIAAAGTRTRYARPAPNAVVHASVLTESASSQAGDRGKAAAPRAPGQAAPASYGAIQIAAPVVRCMTHAIPDSSVPGPAKKSERVSRPEPATMNPGGPCPRCLRGSRTPGHLGVAGTDAMSSRVHAGPGSRERPANVGMHDVIANEQQRLV